MDVASFVGRAGVVDEIASLLGQCRVAAARWLDAGDATMRRALDWALEHDAAAGHDADVAPRLAAALAWKHSVPGNGSWSPPSPRGTPMRRSPAS